MTDTVLTYTYDAVNKKYTVMGIRTVRDDGVVIIPS
jgi:hypothetical protein